MIHGGGLGGNSAKNWPGRVFPPAVHPKVLWAMFSASHRAITRFKTWPGCTQTAAMATVRVSLHEEELGSGHQSVKDIADGFFATFGGHLLQHSFFIGGGLTA